MRAPYASLVCQITYTQRVPRLGYECASECAAKRNVAQKLMNKYIFQRLVKYIYDTQMLIDIYDFGVS